jgi:hypothetical protein
MDTTADLPPWEYTLDEVTVIDRAWFDRDEPEPEPDDDYDTAA